MVNAKLVSSLFPDRDHAEVCSNSPSILPWSVLMEALPATEIQFVELIGESDRTNVRECEGRRGGKREVRRDEEFCCECQICHSTIMVRSALRLPSSRVADFAGEPKKKAQ